MLERRDRGPGERGSRLGVAQVGAVEVDGSDLRRDGVEGSGGDAAAGDVGGVGEAAEDVEKNMRREVVHGNWNGFGDEIGLGH